jgi:hypothetical protein
MAVLMTPTKPMKVTASPVKLYVGICLLITL